MDSLVSDVATSNNSWFARLKSEMLAVSSQRQSESAQASYLNCMLGLVNSMGTSQT